MRYLPDEFVSSQQNRSTLLQELSRAGVLEVTEDETEGRCEMKLCECYEDEWITVGRFCEECTEEFQRIEEFENPNDGEDLSEDDDDE